MKTVLQLGAGSLMSHSIDLLRRGGFRVYAVDRNPSAPGFAFATGHALIDIIDVDAVTAYAQQIGADIILAVNEVGVLPAAEASQRLALPNLSMDVAMRCVDKGLMRACWQKAGLPQPAFIVAHTVDEILQAASAIGYPLVLKPVMNCGSRGVSFVQNAAALPWAVEFAQAHCNGGHYIVEKAIEGVEMTIEGLVRHGIPQVLAKSDKEPQPHPTLRVAMALNYPARFAPWQLDSADAIVTQAAVALGIEDGAFHCECMINERGVYLIEMGGRPGGGHIFGQIVEAASGVCMPQALVHVLLGDDVDIRPRYQLGVCYKFFVPPPGVFHGVFGLDEARSSPGVLDLGFSLDPGTVVGPIAGDADRPGYVVATGVTREEAIANADRAIGAVRYAMGSADAGVELGCAPGKC